MTAERIEQKLKSRGLSQTTFVIGEDWVVWLWAANDPGMGVCVGEGEKYEEALREALLTYDADQASPEKTEPAPPPEAP